MIEISVESRQAIRVMGTQLAGVICTPDLFELLGSTFRCLIMNCLVD
jgi:hypothetical protein